MTILEGLAIVLPSCATVGGIMMWWIGQFLSNKVADITAATELKYLRRDHEELKKSNERLRECLEDLERRFRFLEN